MRRILMTNSQDLRVLRTRNAIKQAFSELIEEKGFEFTSVKDITTRAMINRGTFYAHYQDKFELMEKCQQEIIDGLGNIANFNIIDTMNKLNSKQETSIHYVVSLFQYLEKNKLFLKALLGPNGDLSFQTKTRNIMSKKILGDDYSIFNENQFLVPGEYLVSYMSSAHIGIVQRWLLGDTKETAEEMAKIITTLTINGPLFAAGLKK